MTISKAIGTIIYDNPFECFIGLTITISQIGWWTAVIIHGWP